MFLYQTSLVSVARADVLKAFSSPMSPVKLKIMFYLNNFISKNGLPSQWNLKHFISKNLLLKWK